MQRKFHRLLKLLAYLPLLLLAARGVPASLGTKDKEIPPSFQDYRVQVANIRNPRVDVKSHPIGKTFRTVLSRGVREKGVNFAGWYCLVEWGCGSNCQIFAIVDLRTGRIYHDSKKFILLRGAQYRVDSALFVANPPYPGAEDFLADVPMSYWVWRDRELSCLYPSSACKNVR